MTKEPIKIESPECCKKCSYANESGGCNRSNYCLKWRSWFGKEWRGIQASVAPIIEKRERERLR